MRKSSNTLSSQLESALKRANIPSDATLIIAVSGGPDSCALLGLLAENSASFPERRLVAAHFNHQLRPEADAEEEMVKRLAERFGVEFVCGSEDVAGYADKWKLSVHVAARKLRYQFLGNTARHFLQNSPSNPVYILTAHHRDDQMETMLLRLFSGAGVEGLAGMRLVSPCPGAVEIPLVRPLLTVAKQDLAEYCKSTGIAFATDQSNFDGSYPRAAIRSRITPDIIAAFGEGVVKSIVRSGELLRLSADHLEYEIDNKLNECRINFTRDEIVIDYRTFESYFYVVRLAIFQRCARELTDDENRFSLERFQAADDAVATGDKEIQLGGGIAVRRHRNRVHIYAIQVPWESFAFKEGVHSIPGYGTLTIEKIPVSQAVLPPPTGMLFIDADQLNLDRAVIRHAVAGDIITPLGADYACSVSDLLRDAEIPRHKRNAPVVECDGTIAALLPLRIAHKFRLTDKSRQAFRLTTSIPSADETDY